MRILEGQNVAVFTSKDEREQAHYFLRLYGKHLANCIRRVTLAKPCTCGYQSAIDKVRGTQRHKFLEPML